MGRSKLENLIIILGAIGFLTAMSACGYDFTGQYDFTQTLALDTCSSAPFIGQEQEKSWIVSKVKNDINYFLHGHPQAEYVLTSYDGGKVYGASYIASSAGFRQTWVYLAKLKFKDNNMTGTLREDITVNSSKCSRTYDITKGKRLLKKD